MTVRVIDQLCWGFLNFRKVIKDAADVRIHPVVARQIEPEVLKKLGASPGGPRTVHAG